MIRIYQLNEKWSQSIQVRGETVELFKNPRWKEVIEVARQSSWGMSFRALIDETGDVYVFCSNYLHQDVERETDFTYPARITVDLARSDEPGIIYTDKPGYTRAALANPWVRKHLAGYLIGPENDVVPPLV